MSVRRALTADTWFRRCAKACKENRVKIDGKCEQACDGCGGIGYCMARAREGK